jgi:hypothetical protein
VDEFSGTEAECESFIRIKITDFNEKILEKMEEDTNVRPLIDCFRHETQSEEYEIITLKLQGVGERFFLLVFHSSVFGKCVRAAYCDIFETEHSGSVVIGV